MRFTKMHGCGNDYVYVDGWTHALGDAQADLAKLATAISDRHYGVGGDGLIIVGPPTAAAAAQGANARMRMWNSDGSMSEMCGNGLRCAARLAFELGRIPDGALLFETGAGLLPVELLLDGAGRCTGATVQMGKPRLSPPAIPVQHAGPGPMLPIDFDLGALGRYQGFAVGMGNPHCVIWCNDPDAVPLELVGPKIEHDPRFPKRVNVEFASVAGPGALRQRTWERGSGETLACGTGACAVLVSAVLTGRCPSRAATIALRGGTLDVRWPADDASVVLSGEAVRVFEGEWESPLGG